MNATAPANATAAPSTFADAEQRLAASLPGYTPRPHQQALAAQIEAAIGAETILVAEAGTGTGKSLAALIPAILSGRRVVVATATKALQDQYSGKDLPFLSEHLGAEFRWAVIKGRSNYPCQVKIAELKYPTPGQERVIRAIEALGPGEFLDRDALPAVSDAEWQQLSMTSAECPGREECSAPDDSCYAYRAKDAADAADVVITNLAYLAVDLKLRKETGGAISLLGAFDLLIIDEAHNLDNAVTGALSDRMALGTFTRLGGDCSGWLAEAGYGTSDADYVGFTASRLWTLVTAEYARWLAAREERQGDPIMPVVERTRLAVFGPALREVNGALQELYRTLRSIHDFDDSFTRDGRNPAGQKLLRRKQRLERRVASLMGRLKDFATADDSVSVRWVEQEDFKGQSRLYLIAVPVSPAPFLAENVWSQTPAILMSATLAPARNWLGEADFTYTIESLGLDAFSYQTFESGTPFDYPRQAMLYVPERTVPLPQGKTIAAWRAYAQNVTDHMVLASGGGALLLFTSRSAMEESYRRLAHGFRDAGLEVLKQGDAPTPVLISRFKADGNSVLFALRTFFEGIDIPGKALRLVIIDKLPFPVPTDLLFAARCDVVNHKAGREVSFQKLSMPMMTLPLIQAAGRLLRTSEDRGVIAILDPRLSAKTYGAKILHSLPPARATSDPHEVLDFLKAMNGRQS